jgi:hypothetical protein
MAAEYPGYVEFLWARFEEVQKLPPYCWRRGCATSSAIVSLTGHIYQLPRRRSDLATAHSSCPWGSEWPTECSNIAHPLSGSNQATTHSTNCQRVQRRLEKLSWAKCTCDPRIALTMRLNRSVCGTRRRSGNIGDDRRFSFFQFNGQLVTTLLVFVVVIIVGRNRPHATALGHNDPVGGQLSQSLGQDLVLPGMEPMVLALRLQFGRSLFRSLNPSRPTRRFHSTGRVDRILHKMKPNVGEFCMRCEWSYVRASNFTNRRTPNNWNRARSDRRTPALVDKRTYGQNNTTRHKNV